MARAGANFRAHELLDLPRHLGVVEKTDALLHLQADHDAEAMHRAQIQQPAGRNVIGPDGVEPIRRNFGKILVDHLVGGIRGAIGAAPEGAVRHAVDLEFLFTHPEEFPFHGRP